MGLGHADGVLAEALGLEFRELGPDLLVGDHLFRAVNLARDHLRLVPEAQVIVIQRAKLRRAAAAKRHDFLGEIRGTGAAVSPVRAADRLDAEARTEFLDDSDFSIGVGRESVDCDHDGNAELGQVSHVPVEVLAAPGERLDILLAKVFLRDAALHLECLDGRDQHGGIGPQAGFAALDIEELLSAEICAETRFGHDVVGQLEASPGRHDRIAAMRDVRERPAVHQRRVVFHRLHEIRLQCVAQQHGHCTVRVQLPDGHGLVLARIPEDDVTEPGLEVREIRRETENRHDFRRDRDVETRLANDAVVIAAETRGHRAQRPVVHIHDATPGHTPGIDVQFVFPVHMVVDQSCEQVVRCADRVEVTGKMQVDVRHGDDLRVTAAGCPALHAETGTEARLTQADERLLADPVQRVAETYRRGRLAFAGRRWRHRGHEDELAVFPLAVFGQVTRADLGLVVAVGNKRISGYAQLAGDVLDRQHFRRRCDFNVGFDSHVASFVYSAVVAADSIAINASWGRVQPVDPT